MLSPPLSVWQHGDEAAAPHLLHELQHSRFSLPEQRICYSPIVQGLLKIKEYDAAQTFSKGIGMIACLSPTSS